MVFPTPVGMDRRSGPRTMQKPGFPHARGDGPSPLYILNSEAQFSPRPWGWTDGRPLYHVALKVFPTPVGMDRLTGSSTLSSGSFPHARGDGPPEREHTPPALAFSPRPWGWTAVGGTQMASFNVFPTPVGMDRRSDSPARKPASFPHARGDGPNPSPVVHPTGLFSPRPWGWTEDRRDDAPDDFVFPTPVGMDRDR